MTLPVSARTPVRVTIPNEPDAPVYLVQVPKLMDRADWRRRLNGAAVHHDQVAMLRALRQEVASALDAGPERDRTLETIDLFRADPAGADDEIRAEIDRIEQAALGASQAYRALRADNTHYGEVALLLAARRFLIGVEGPDGAAAPYLRRDDLVADAVFDDLSDTHVLAIGGKALELLTLSGTAGNGSAGPSPSGGDPGISPAANERPTAVPAGSSSAKSTKSTPASA